MNVIQSYIKEISLPEETVRSDDFKDMVYTVFSDGEVSLQKAGSLLWKRNLHMVMPGHPTAKLPADWFPYRFNDYPFVFCAGHKQALDLWSLINKHFQ